MPKKVINDYIFYKIVCLDNSVELCYVGSTANWKERQRTHKNNCKNESNILYNSKIYKNIRDNGGWSNFKMIEIGKKEQLTKRQAEQIEEEYRIMLKANMNAIRCYTTEEQKQEYRKEYDKNYRNLNKDKILEYQQNYNQENKDKKLEYNQNYYEENTDKILKQKQKYREDNNAKVNCECGCEVSKLNLSTHKKRPKHIKLMNQIKI